MNRYIVWVFVIADLLVVVPRSILMFVDAHGVSFLAGLRPHMVGFTAIGTALLLSTGAAIIGHWLFKDLPAGSRLVLLATWLVAVLSLLGLLVPYLLADLEGQHLSEVLNQRGWALSWSLLAVGAPVVEMLGLMGAWALDSGEQEQGFFDQLAGNLGARALEATAPSSKQAPELSTTKLKPKPKPSVSNGDFICSGCGESFDTKQALGGHRRWCGNE